MPDVKKCPCGGQVFHRAVYVELDDSGEKEVRRAYRCDSCNQMWSADALGLPEDTSSIVLMENMGE